LSQSRFRGSLIGEGHELMALSVRFSFARSFWAGVGFDHLPKVFTSSSVTCFWLMSLFHLQADLDQTAKGLGAGGLSSGLPAQ
jgi:hypothetical protein